jgi:DNA polymerase-1
VGGVQLARYEVGGWPDRSAELRVARTVADLAELDAWLAERAERPLGLDLETNAADPWHRGYRTRCVQIADVDCSWAVPITPDNGAWLAHDVSRMIRRHPLFVAHFAEADIRFASRGLPDSPIRLYEPTPHVVDLQVALAIYDPRTVTTANKAERIDPRIPRKKGLKETTTRLLTPTLQAAETALHARFRELAPTGWRTPAKSRQWGFAHIPDDDPTYLLYAALDPLCTIRLWHLLLGEIGKRGQLGRLRAALVEQWMMDGATFAGLQVDGPYARWLDTQLADVVDKLTGYLAQFDVPPSGQGPAVGRALAELGVEPVKVNDNGAVSWDRAALTMLIEQLEQQAASSPSGSGVPGRALQLVGPAHQQQAHQRARARGLAQAVLDVRRAGKFRSAYVAPMLRAVDAGDGAMHCGVRALGTITSRMTHYGTESAGPLGQLPKRDTRIRAAVRSRRGQVLVSADYRQAEPHVMAALCGDEVMLADLLAGDINAAIATMVYGDINDGGAYDKTQGKTAGTPSYAMRQSAKFGWLAWCYSCSPRKLAALLGRPLGEGEAIIERWRGRYRRFAAWQDEVNKLAVVPLDSGWRVPLWDRCWVDDDGALRLRYRYGAPVPSRLGPNAATQGGQRDLLAVSMHRLNHAGWSWALRFALHDELLLEVPAPMAEQARADLEAAMTVTYRGVTIGCEATIEGRTWLAQPTEFDHATLTALDEEDA